MRIQNLNDSFIQIINGEKIEKKQNKCNKLKRELLFKCSSTENINTIPFNKSDFDIQINTLKNINTNSSNNQNNNDNQNHNSNNKKIDDLNKKNNNNNIQLNNQNNNKEINNSPNKNINNNYYIKPIKYKDLLINNSLNLNNNNSDDNSKYSNNNNITQNYYLGKKVNPYIKSQNLIQEKKTFSNFQDSFNILFQPNLETIINENPSSFDESYIPHNMSTDGNNPFLFDFIKLEPSVDKQTLKEKNFPVNKIKKKMVRKNYNILTEPINLEFQNFTVNNNNNNKNNNYYNNNIINNYYYNNNRSSNGINSKLFNYNKIALIYNENENENQKISKVETAKKMISNKKEYINDEIFQNNKNIINKNINEIDKMELKNIINKGFYPKTGISSDNTIKNNNDNYNNDNISNSILAFGTPQRNNNNDDIFSLDSSIIQKNYYNLLRQKQEHKK
jgi:hypothetical protein